MKTKKKKKKVLTAAERKRAVKLGEAMLKIEKKFLAREAKKTPQQRIDRSKRYFERKQAAKSQQNRSP